MGLFIDTMTIHVLSILRPDHVVMSRDNNDDKLAPHGGEFHRLVKHVFNFRPA